MSIQTKQGALLAKHYYEGGSFDTAFDSIWDALALTQSLAVLEVVHSAVGITRSSFMTTFMQVFSRIFLVWAILYGVPASRTSWSVSLMVASWCLADVPRYMWYTLNQASPSRVPFALTYIRFSAFILMYLTGISGELITIWHGLDAIKADRPWSITMPNPWNVCFDFYWATLFVLALYIPGSPIMYTHMLKQRKKRLSGGDKKKSA